MKQEREKLEKLASLILKEDVLAGLKKWYLQTMDERWSYVVFIVRRSYILALIMEILTGRPMESNKIRHCLTDASIMLHCEELADAYRRDKRIPPILLCDDVCIHGRNINHFIAMIEERLIFLLPEFDEADIKEAVLEAVRIHVYVKLEGPSLLLGKYEFNFSFMCRENTKFIYGFSSDISMLVLQSGIANASYIYSERVPFAGIELNDFIETSYQNNIQYTLVKFIGNYSRKKAIFSLRILKNMNEDEQCTVLPFVFMPNLGAEETEEILKVIQKRMRERSVQEEYIERLSKLEKIPGKRTFNELITLMFSCVLLQDFNKKNNIIIPQAVKQAEIIKLARNYDWYGLEDAQKWIDNIISVQLFTVKEMAEILDDLILPERKMIYILPGIRTSLSEMEKKQIRDKVENYFYRKGCEEEREAYELSRKIHVNARERVSRTVRGCGFLFWEISEGYEELEARYCVAYFLQMIDAGAGCLSSFAPNYINVVGMSQFAKTGEQSLMSEPLKFYEWIPTLALIEDDCGGKILEFYSALKKYEESSYCDYDKEKSNEIEEFIQNIYSMGHKIRDWNIWSISYLYRLEINLPSMEYLSQHQQRTKFLDLQLKHIMDYKDYKRNY